MAVAWSEVLEPMVHASIALKLVSEASRVYCMCPVQSLRGKATRACVAGRVESPRDRASQVLHPRDPPMARQSPEPP